MNNNIEHKKTYCFVISVFFFAIFLFLLIYFIRIHPFAIFDTDNWTYIASKRNAVPIWGYWNPIKVFPETVMGYISDIGVFCIFPFISDYILSVTTAHAVFISLAITIYVFLAWRYFRKKYSLSVLESIAITFMYFICHFWIFRRFNTGNQHMFYDISLNNYYNYLLPALINTGLILFFLVNDDFFKRKEKTLKSGFIFLVIYFAIFSNIFQSAFLIIYIGVILMVDFISSGYRLRDIFKYLKMHAIEAGIIVSWLISLFFEYNGARAGASSERQFVILPVVKGLFMFLYENLNVYFTLFTICVFTAGIVIEIKNRKEREKGDNILLTSVICMLLILIFEVLICGKIGERYISRTSVLFGGVFFVLLIIFHMLVVLIKNHNGLCLILPILIYIAVNNITLGERVFAESTYKGLNPRLLTKIDNDILQQITDADNAGLNEVTVHVLKSENSVNWPQAEYLGERMSVTLYRHGITENKMDIRIVPDESINKKYGVYFYD